MTQTQSRVDEYLSRGLRHLWVQTQQYNDLAKDDGFVVINGGDGIYVSDIKGRRFIDAMSGLWVVAVGHGRTELADVAKRQMETLAYANPFAYATEPAVDLATKLAEITPPSIQKAFFVNSGSEAVESAIRMAKQYHFNNGERRKTKVIARIGSYHGTTAMAMSVNGAAYMNKKPFEPLVPGVIHVENINCARCPFEKTYPECEVFCARHVEDEIKFQDPATIAAIIAEPISTANGCWVPQQEYWQILRDICDRHNILLIADEVIDGFGRTGKWFGIQHYPIEPDIMTVAKGISSGYAPISAALASDKVAEAFVGDRQDAFVGGITWGANPVSCAVALANIEIIERERLVENAESVGGHLAKQLQELRTRHKVIADTRGIGLMHTLEMKRNPETGEDFREDDNVSARMPELLKQQGILARAGAAISIAPPLVINREEVDALIDGLDQAIGQLEQDLQIA
ncbi:MAG: aspartate aminotransferase family protein [Chloroflexi bacterium]|nr:aspartate aminotransferase family protein [Chloroflexota bacterium]MDA1004652.1 aspartate aminotransferase family protein [Chloroflexota bacterium]